MDAELIAFPGTRMTMYEEFFGFSHRPFPSVPSLAGYVESDSHAEAIDTILRCVRRDEGIATLVAAPGLGKSTIALRLKDELDGQFEVVHLNSGHCGSRRALLQALAYELGLPHRGMEEGELRIQFAEHVERVDSRRLMGIVILADEADLLPIRLLEELRLLTNFAHNERSRVSVVLMGNLSLEERLASPYLVSFNQRIGARAYLQPLSNAEVSLYVRQQIKQAGAKRTIFDDSAIEAIARLTTGVPRLINQICDHSLLLASLGDMRTLDGEGVEEAWADLQRLPAPKRQIRHDAAHSTDSLIEFGSLEEPTEPVAEFPSVVRFQDRDLATEEQVFEPVAMEEPEVELTFQNATNPFEERFAQEEVIIDRFASLGDAEVKGIRRVLSPRNSEIAAFLIGTEENPSEVDVVQPEYVNADSMVVSRDYSTDSTSFSNLDDRDIIVIESPVGKEAPVHPKMPAPRRRTYRQLFSQLRREHA
ncbi:ExeA family protein [Bremerella cremea]|uniref:ExeA family protein n=1 Tax=Bremerella cremea TaxID=1031537 RepID=UPI0031E8241B